MNKFQIISKLGEGSFASVYKVKRKQDSKQYALKRIKIQPLNQKEIASCLNEVRILASVQNPYVVKYMDSFYDELSSSFCLITEFLQGGDLSQYIKSQKALKKQISQQKIWMVAIQCLKGLKGLHKMNIIHRDIKSANIFINKDLNVFKLGDMNVSKISDNGMARTQAGTPYYASPEVWYDKPYTSKCDIWSLGCVLYEMAMLLPPFLAKDIRSLQKVIVKGKYELLSSDYSAQLNQFIQLCLQVDPVSRFSAQQLLNSTILKQVRFWKLDQRVKDKEDQQIICEQKILQKIQAPKKKDFYLIRQKLPQHKFQKTISNAQIKKKLKRQLSKKQNNQNKENNQEKQNKKQTSNRRILQPIQKQVTSVNLCKNIRILQQHIVTMQQLSLPPIILRKSPIGLR